MNAKFWYEILPSTEQRKVSLYKSVAFQKFYQIGPSLDAFSEHDKWYCIEQTSKSSAAINILFQIKDFLKDDNVIFWSLVC